VKLFYHSADLDGHCSAAIVKDRYPEAELYPINYGDQFPWSDIHPGEEVWMVDFHLDAPGSMFDLLMLCNGNLTWIDHHVSAIKQYQAEFAERGDAQGIPGKREVGKAACELTWEYLHRHCIPQHFPVPKLVHLLGRYDVWDQSDQWAWDKEILPFQMGMRLGDTDPVTMCWDTLFEIIRRGQEGQFIDSVIHNGEIVLAYQRNWNAAYMRSHAYEIEWNGIKCLVCNIGRANSQAFDSMFNPRDHDLMVAYSCVKGHHYTVSLYSDTVDCSKIAVANGGGGHRGAAGFTCKRLPWGEI